MAQVIRFVAGAQRSHAGPPLFAPYSAPPLATSPFAPRPWLRSEFIEHVVDVRR